MTGQFDDLGEAIGALRQHRDVIKKQGLERDFLRVSVAAANIGLRTESAASATTAGPVADPEKLERAYSVLRGAVAKLVEQSTADGIEGDELRLLAARSENVLQTATLRAQGPLGKIS
jgi:hypothetical protein